MSIIFYYGTLEKAQVWSFKDGNPSETNVTTFPKLTGKLHKITATGIIRNLKPLKYIIISKQYTLHTFNVSSRVHF